MNWKKLKRIFCAEGQHEWMMTHAANALPINIGNSIFRIYFSCRNIENIAYVGYVDVDFENNFEVINISDKPVISPGKIGAFDDNGISLGCYIEKNDEEYLYYLGWNLPKNVPFRNSIGYVKRRKGQTDFIREYEGPTMDRNIIDPYSLSYPFIIFDEGKYKMWYGSHKQWGPEIKDMIHPLKYAESNDGINWDRTNIICLDTDDLDYAFSKPCVIKEEGLYKMFYCFRGVKYRIGYAESQDGKTWIRKDDEIGIDITENSWDSDMICYPYVFDYKERRYMLYSGNGYGKTGFGIAILEKQ
ncbi:MAG: hypothetical protein RJA07_60 [Bacteroidota bacterium]|jgi:hypothetical protein